jgi:hypothetical protein
MSQGALTEACPKLEKSFQLAPRLGTMLNLGSCFERRGQLARAIAVYERAATLARQQGRTDRETAARELAAALEPKVGKLLIVIEEPSRELVVQVDGETLSTRSGLLPLDPGRRHLTARALGKVPWEAILELKPGSTLTVTVPRLADEPSPPPPQSPALATPSEDSTLRTAGLIAGFGVAATGVTVGTIYGLLAKSRFTSSKGECDATGCSDRGISLIDDAKSAGNVSTAAFIVGGVALAVTITFLVVTGKPLQTPRAAALATF